MGMTLYTKSEVPLWCSQQLTLRLLVPQMSQINPIDTYTPSHFKLPIKNQTWPGNKCSVFQLNFRILFSKYVP